jgi:hypothetical protein
MSSNKSLFQEDAVNSCYCDESGIGQEPIATMVGVIVDASRMRKTKEDWQFLLGILSNLAGKKVAELHTADFYAGNGVWRIMEGPDRASFIDAIFNWLTERKHSIVYSSVNKNIFHANSNIDIPAEINNVWQFMGFHLILSIQKYQQTKAKNKGNTYLFFDNEEREERRFIDLVKNPPNWSDEYYARAKKQSSLDQIIDSCPHFSDSKDVGLLQVADFLAFFLRRYAEISENLSAPDYADEKVKLKEWIGKFQQRMIPQAHIYPKTARKLAHKYFCKYGSKSLMSLRNL